MACSIFEGRATEIWGRVDREVDVVFAVCGGIVELALNQSVDATSKDSKELTLGDPGDSIDLDLVSA